MSMFLWICIGLGLFAGILEVWANNQKKNNTAERWHYRSERV